jgi:hypothetical protein
MKNSLMTCHPRQAINDFDGSEALQLVCFYIIRARGRSIPSAAPTHLFNVRRFAKK